MGKYKNRLLFSIFRVVLFLFLLAACMLDSLDYRPMVLFFVTGLYITLFVSVNWERFFYTREDDEV